VGLAGSAGRPLALVAALTIGACDSDSPDVAAPTTTYTVSFDLEATDGPLGALQFDVAYRGGGDAGWVGAGGGAACRWIVQAAIHMCNNKRGGKLTCAVVDTGGFTGPIPLLECELVSTNDALTADDFEIEVTDASTPNLEPVDAGVTVSSVVAIPDPTTTTTNPDNPPDEYDVVLAIPEDEISIRPIGALQFDITHEGVVGGWVGSGGDVDCRWLVSADVSGCNEKSNRLLTCAVVSTAGFRGPRPILECGFATYEGVVDTSDFSVVVVDASAPDLFPLDVEVQVDSVTLR
jgi:hypothetical protein